MSQRIYNFEKPDRFVAGAIGQPGSRTFHLQAREGERIVSVLLEKVQVALLAERLAQLLAELRERGAKVPEEPMPADVDAAPLDEPIVWDGDDESIVIEAAAVREDDATDDATGIDADAEPDVLRVHLDPRRALAFAQRALEVVAAGRPPCPFCGQPLNPEGHVCARRNGFMH
jgi:uncharacterized repeat protein (TIGR03847 family)